MSINSSTPDYDLEDTLELTTPAQVRAIGDELRTTILGLLHERAATVTELASAVKLPKSTVGTTSTSWPTLVCCASYGPGEFERSTSATTAALLACST